MKIILKHLLNNIKEKMFRTALILVVLASTTAIFIINFDLTQNLIGMYSEMYEGMLGDSDISITGSPEKGTMVFEEQDIELKDTKVLKKTGVFTVEGELGKDNKLSIVGVNLESFQKMISISYIDEIKAVDFKDNKAIISRKFADNQKLELGDGFEITVSGEEHKLEVGAIADSKGAFLSETSGSIVIIPIATANAYYSQEDKINCLYVDVDESEEELNEIVKGISDNNEDYEISKVSNSIVLNSRITSISNSFTVCLVIILVISFYIIFSTFKVIIAERLPVMGTFRSVGATARQTNFIILLESVLYGVIGGAFGIAMGCIGLYVIADFMNTLKEYGIKTSVDYNIAHILMAYLLTIVIATVSASLNVIKARKFSTKEIILNTVHTEAKERKINKYIGVCFIAAGFVMNEVNKYNIIMSVVVLLFIVVGFVLVIPFLIGMFSYVFGFIANILRPEAKLASKNLRKNKLVINNIILIAIGISLIIMLDVVNSSISAMIKNTEDTIQYDFYVRNIGETEKIFDCIKEVEAVSAYYEDYTETFLLYKGEDKIGTIDIWAIDDKDQFSKFYGKQFDIEDGLYDKLKEDNSIILDRYIGYVNDIEIGDTVAISLDGADKDTVDYEVVGFYDSTIMSNKMVASISKDSYVKEFDLKTPFQILIQTTGDVDKAYDTLSNKFDGRNETLVSVKENLQEQKENFIDTIMNASKIFILLSIFMAVFGMSNNMVVSFIERKKEYAVLYSVCMNKSQIRRMLFWESVNSSFASAIMGGGLGVMIICVMPQILGSIGLVVGVSYSVQHIITILVATFFILIFVSIVSMFKVSKMNIIEELKYE